MVACAALSSCRVFPLQPPDATWAVTGTITRMQTWPGAARILVEEHPGPLEEHNGDKTFFGVSGATAIFIERPGESYLRGASKMLVTGMRVRAWPWDGNVADSYPGQATAESIVILSPQ